MGLCARGAQQQAGQQIADRKKTGLAVLLENHAPDYKQIFRASQAPASSPPAENRRATLAVQSFAPVHRGGTGSSNNFVGADQDRFWNGELEVPYRGQGFEFLRQAAVQRILRVRDHREGGKRRNRLD